MWFFPASLSDSPRCEDVTPPGKEFENSRFPGISTGGISVSHWHGNPRFPPYRPAAGKCTPDCHGTATLSMSLHEAPWWAPPAPNLTRAGAERSSG